MPAVNFAHFIVVRARKTTISTDDFGRVYNDLRTVISVSVLLAFADVFL